jgi:hypothetical protein
MSNSTKRLYYLAEYTSLGDILPKDNRLSQKEFTRLVTLLGMPEADRAAEVSDPGVTLTFFFFFPFFLKRDA